MATATRTRKTLRAPKGTVAWVGEDHIRITRKGCDPETYLVLRHAGGWWVEKPDGEFYLIDTRRPLAWACNCPDATHRPERRNCCKHVCALRAALARVPF